MVADERPAKVTLRARHCCGDHLPNMVCSSQEAAESRRVREEYLGKEGALEISA